MRPFRLGLLSCDKQLERMLSFRRHGGTGGVPGNHAGQISETSLRWASLSPLMYRCVA
jgi:hypothetical protein